MPDPHPTELEPISHATITDPTTDPVTFHTHDGIDSPKLHGSAVNPGGADTQVQFNDGGALGGDPRLLFDKSSGDITFGAANHQSQINMPAGSGTEDGGKLNIVGGDGGATSGAGGFVQLSGGFAMGGNSNGGEVGLFAGDGHGSGSGGDVDIESGQPAVGGNGNAGAISIFASGGDGSGSGGEIDIAAGNGGSSGVGGDINIESGAGGGSAAAGAINLTAGDGVSGDGGSINLSPGSSSSGANGVVNINAAYVSAAALHSPSAGATATLDLSTANEHRIQMPAGNITIALAHDSGAEKFIISITQDSVGSRSVTWFTTIRWAGGSAPTLTTTANQRDTFGFIRTGAGTYDGFIVGQNI